MLGLLAPGVGMGGTGVGGITWTTHSVIRLLEYGTSHALDVTIRAPSGTAYARLWDKTGGAEISLSQVETLSATVERKRSSALNLALDREYQIQGGQDGGSFEIWSAMLVEV